MTKTSSLTAMAALALLSQSSAAWKLNLPKATVSVDLPLDGWTPKPTPPPGGLRRLNKRQFNDEFGQDEDEDDEDADGTTVLMAPDNTCGFVSGRPGAHYTCAGTYNCVFFTASAPLTGNVACCDDFNCGVRIDCINYDEYYSSSVCDDGCDVDAFTLKCTNTDMPFCNTVSFSSSIYDFWCNSLDISTAQSATTVYSGQDRSFESLALEDESTSFTFTEETSVAPGPTITNDPNDEDSEDGSDGGSNGGDGDSNGGDQDGSNNNDNNGGGSGGGGGGTPVGPIVGGVVGGVAAIGLGGLALWLFLRKKKKNKQASTSDMSQPSPSVAYANQPPGPHGQSPPPPGGQGYYDPKFVAAGGHQQPVYQPQQYQPQQPQYAPQQQQGQQHPGGFYPMGNTPPAGTSTSSPTMSYADPNAVSPNGQSSPGAVYPSGVSGLSPGGQQQYAGGSPQGGGYIHEAPSRPEEMQRGGVHELG